MINKKHTYGLIGKKLTHSFSPQYFEQKFVKLGLLDHCYKAIELDNISFFQETKEKGYSGLNVTIPYKSEIIPFLDQLDPISKEIQAVNTIVFDQGKLIGYNTDVIGFGHSLKTFLQGQKIDRALILGTGGASKAVSFVLSSMDIDYDQVTRSKEGYIKYDDLTENDMNDYRLIINTTPLGTSPKIDSYPKIPYGGITEKHFLFDLIYNPEKTLFLKKGEEQNAKIQNGFDMLILQAEASWDIWRSINN